MSKNSVIAVSVGFILSVAVTFAIIKFKNPAAKPIESSLFETPVVAVNFRKFTLKSQLLSLRVLSPPNRPSANPPTRTLATKQKK